MLLPRTTAAGLGSRKGEEASGAGKDYAGQLQDEVASAAANAKAKARGKHASGGEL